MKHIDEAKLETDVEYRFNYLCEFIGFGQEDIDVIHGAAPLLAPLVSALVDGVYNKLFERDATWRHFVPKQDGYEGDTPASVEALDMNHPQIEFRKQHLATYLTKLVSDPYDGKLVKYLDAVGRMHTPKSGSDKINVPLVQMNALLGFVADVFNATIFGMDIPEDAKQKAVRAFGKLLWIQNDLINRHYAD